MQTMIDTATIRAEYYKKAVWLIVKLVLWILLLVFLLLSAIGMTADHFTEFSTFRGRDSLFWLYISLGLISIAGICLVIVYNRRKHANLRRVQFYQRIIEKLLYVNQGKTLALTDVVQLTALTEEIVSRELDSMLSEGRIAATTDQNDVVRYEIVIR